MSEHQGRPIPAGSLRSSLIFQLAIVAIAELGFLLYDGRPLHAGVWYGGAVAMLNVLLLHWRRAQLARNMLLDAGASLRRMVASAIERFLVVCAGLALAMTVFGLDGAEVMVGFTAGLIGMVLFEGLRFSQYKS